MLLLSCLLALALCTPSTVYAANGDMLDGKTPQELGVTKGALPEVSMPAGALVTSDGRVLWSRNASDRRAMASLTKIMTAVVAMENSTPDEVVKVPADASAVGESTSFLVPGDTIRMSELLEGLLVKSGNDAAVTIAEHVAGDEAAFVAMMNKKAKELGLEDTHFANSHGLDEKGHYTSASDLAVMARYAMTKPEFRSIVGKKRATVSSRQHKHVVDSTNLLLMTYTGANGVKTGWTSDAGQCLIGSAQRNGVELYAVVLGTGSEAQRFAQTRELLDWGFAHYRPQRLASRGTVLGSSAVVDYIDTTINGVVSRDETRAVYDLAGPITRKVSMADQRAPVRKGQRVGVATFTQGDTIVATVPLVATTAVDKPNIFERAWIGTVRIWLRLSGRPLHAAWERPTVGAAECGRIGVRC